ncbi:hypothetical protein IKF87_01395 [Candidatus Saccharibacteria bacterium]|nr:hypothetical protein [Candidatus Saccharibacteria bacterium]
MHNNRYLIVPTVLVTASLLSGTLLMSNKTSADNDSAVDNISISIPVSCTLSGTGMNSHNATIPNGTYQDSIGTTTLKAFCNDTNGFAIYANGYTNDTLGNNKLIGSSTSSEIVTGTATTAGSPDVSNWAMKLATDSSATYPITLDNGYGSYSNVPSSYIKVAHRDSGTDLGSSATGASLTSTYAAYISKTQPADTYIGKVKYTMVHPNDAAAPSTKTIADATYMQEVGKCPASLTTGMVYELTDSRDNQKYRVAKLKDGNCWMLQNLKLGRSTSTLTLTPANSDVGSNYTLDNKLPSPGKFHAYTIDGVPYQNNSTEYYCTGDGTASDWESCYYNWYTATAGAGTTYIATQGQNVNNSICPAGWTLPTQPQFQALYNQYPSAAEMLVANPTTAKENAPTVGQVTNTPGFLLSGSYAIAGAGTLGSYGVYWSRTAGSAPTAYSLRMDTSSVDPANYYRKHGGFAVRCVAGV